MKHTYLILMFLVFYTPFSMQAVVENHSFLLPQTQASIRDTTIASNVAVYKLPSPKEKTFEVFDTYSKRMLIYPFLLLLLQIAFVGMFSIGLDTFGLSQIGKMLYVALLSIAPLFLLRWGIRTNYKTKGVKKNREAFATQDYNRSALFYFGLLLLLTVSQFSSVRFNPLLFAGAAFVGSSSDTIQAVETVKRKVKKDKTKAPEVITEQKDALAEKGAELKVVPSLPKVVIKKDTIAQIIALPKPIAKKEVAPIIPEPELRLLERAGKFGFKDLNGNTVIAPKYSIAYDFSEGLAQVQLDNKWGFINKKGELICPIQYEDCNAFSEGLAVVQKNGTYGYMSKDGKIRIAFQYSSASNFKGECATVEKDGQKFRINSQGKKLFDVKN